MQIIFRVNIHAECAIARPVVARGRRGRKEKEEEGGRMEGDGGKDQVERF